MTEICIKSTPVRRQVKITSTRIKVSPVIKSTRIPKTYATLVTPSATTRFKREVYEDDYEPMNMNNLNLVWSKTKEEPCKDIDSDSDSDDLIKSIRDMQPVPKLKPLFKITNKGSRSQYEKAVEVYTNNQSYYVRNVDKQAINKLETWFRVLTRSCRIQCHKDLVKYIVKDNKESNKKTVEVKRIRVVNQPA